MRKAFILSILCISLFACPTTTTETPIKKPTDNQITSFSEVIKIPKGYKKLAEVNGDLDRDSINEKIFVFDTGEEGDLGTKREVRIYIKGQKEWKLWHKAKNAVLSSQSGGIMGDPFQDLRIERGCIVLDHLGGSRQKWNYTHRYRYNRGDWTLIGLTAVVSDPCNQVETFDYNLSSGKVIYKKDFEACSGDNRKITKTESETFNYKQKRLPEMGQFEFEEIYAVAPKTGKCVPENACYNYSPNGDN